MKYFAYSPLDMSEAEALKRAEPYLQIQSIVYVRNKSVAVVPVKPGMRLIAPPDNYLVRVEQDGSTRIVDRRISD